MVTLIAGGGGVAAGESGAIGGNERIVGTIASPDRLIVLCSRRSGTTTGFEAADRCEGRVFS
jgi:hypothetical protein